MKTKYIGILMLLVTVTMLMGTVSAAKESDSWNINKSNNYTDANNKIITSGETNNFKYYAISKYNGKPDIGKSYTGYFIAKSKDKKIKIKNVKLQIYDGNTGKTYIKTFKGNNKNQILIKLGENRTLNVYQDGFKDNPIVAKMTFQRSTHDPNGEVSNNPAVGYAAMKKTGIPINLLLLVLLSLVGWGCYRRQ